MAESNNNEPKKNEDGASNSGKDAPLLSLSDLRPDKIATVSPSGAASLASVKKEPSKFGIWIHKHCAWLFNIHSLFYFGLIIFAVAMGWTGYALINNSFVQAYGWDFCSQFMTFYYDFWDDWHEFFRTGKFVLYDTNTFLGTDNIGSNSYYGLFDPFVVALNLFPRAWIPQTSTIMTLLKLVVAAFCMRAYLKYMDIQEGTARFGAVAYAFSGYMCFMAGFQTTVAACCYVPLILLGIEKVIKERKPSCLIWGLFLEGITSFFFLVVLCIWGVLYALWRFFWTIKQRKAKENWLVIAFGVASFGVGLLLCSWTLLPSLRESSLSGRTVSVGSIYLAQITNALKSFDIKSLFTLLFQQVGDNTGRELMGLISFFYPTSGYLYLPLSASAGGYVYDSWTASIFCYTPFVILFFVAFMNSIRKKKWNHLILIAICLYLLFTTFAYYFFYAFTGNGYGRWFIILVPEIIYYGCWAFDDRKNQPKAFMPTATLLALAGTIGTYALTVMLLSGKTFTPSVNADGYYVTSYLTAGEVTGSVSVSRMWYIYYQCALVVIEGAVMTYFLNKEWLHKVLFAFISVEAIVAGNMSFVYGALWNIDTAYNGGAAAYANTTEVLERVNNQDRSFFRTYCDASGEGNYAMGVNYNGASCFHSLMNFETYDFDVMAHITDAGATHTAYGTSYWNPSWGGKYANKRYAADIQLGYKKYIIKNDGYWVKDDAGNDYNFESQNVPFDCVLDEKASGNDYRVYTYDDEAYATNSYVSLGHGVDNSKLFAIEHTSGSQVYSRFYGGGDATNTRRAEHTMVEGAILTDEDAANMPEGFTTSSATPTAYGSQIYCYGRKYSTTGENKYLPASGTKYAADGPAYFLKESGVSTYTNFASGSYQRDLDHIVFYPTTGFGSYFNSDPNGAYFDLYTSTSNTTRYYMIGDTYKDDGNGNKVIDKTDQLLNFEYHAIDNMGDAAGTYRNLFGMYAKGRVKYIVVCAPGPAESNGVANYVYFSSDLRIYMQERSAIEQQYDFLRESKFQNVVQVSSNEYTFTTNYDATTYPDGRFCVTQIAYDKGWSVTANGKSLKTYKLDGGFVGFIAPAGEATYDMVYVTPYIKGTSFLFAGGIIVYASYLTYGFVRDLKRIKKEQQDLAVAPRGK
ncbi:MAG: Bacterial membrane protein YfhO [Tenericutes bacterium ADurb.BinA155]|nr:MAG: Bacterial membrane protein YfhO [Tenericutes bacterium ADurb.BinA155]